MLFGGNILSDRHSWFVHIEFTYRNLEIFHYLLMLWVADILITRYGFVWILRMVILVLVYYIVTYYILTPVLDLVYFNSMYYKLSRIYWLRTPIFLQIWISLLKGAHLADYSWKIINLAANKCMGFTIHCVQFCCNEAKNSKFSEGQPICLAISSPINRLLAPPAQCWTLSPRLIARVCVKDYCG